MSYYDILKILLNFGCMVALIQFAIMIDQKRKHPEKLKQIQRIATLLNYQLFGCGVLLGLVIKLSW